MSPRNREIPALDLLQDTLETAVARQHQWIRDTYSRLRGQQAPTGNKGDEEIVENQALTHEEIKVALALRYKEVRAECEEQAAQAWEELTERSDLEAFKYTCDCAALHMAVRPWYPSGGGGPGHQQWRTGDSRTGCRSRGEAGVGWQL